MNSHFFQALDLVRDYLQYPVLQRTSVETVDFSDPMVYPRITICNLQPMQSDFPYPGRFGNDNKSIADFYNKFKEQYSVYATCNGTCKSDTIDFARDDLSSAKGFIQYYGKDIADELSHQRETFIIACTVSFDTRVYAIFEPCAGVVSIKKVFHPVQYNCFEVDLPTTHNGEIRAVSLVLFLDNLPASDRFPFHLHADRNSVGAWLMVSKKGQGEFVGEIKQLAPGESSSWSWVIFTHFCRLGFLLEPAFLALISNRCEHEHALLHPNSATSFYSPQSHSWPQRSSWKSNTYIESRFIRILAI